MFFLLLAPCIVFYLFVVVASIKRLLYMKSENRYKAEYIDGVPLGLDVDDVHHIRIEGVGIKTIHRRRGCERKVSGEVEVYWHPDFEKGIFRFWSVNAFPDNRL